MNVHHYILKTFFSYVEWKNIKLLFHLDSSQILSWLLSSWSLFLQSDEF